MLRNGGGKAFAVLLGLALASGAAGQEAGVLEANPGWAGARAAALVAREALEREVEAMKRVMGAQEVLMSWNADRAKVGSTARTLDPDLCDDEEVRRWCAQLPATFGLEGRRQ